MKCELNSSLKKNFILLMYVGALCFLFSSLAFAYQIPRANQNSVHNENLMTLQKISKGVSEIAKEANKGIVFVSVSKTLEGLPMGFMDPFEFFFGPNFRGNPGPKRRGPSQQQKMPKQEGLGSGFIIDLEKGYIMTNNHVIEGADEILLKFSNGEKVEGKVIGRDEDADVAIVKVKDDKFSKKGLSPLHIGNSDELAVGDFVVALGAPFSLEASLSFGVVSALQRGNLDITRVGDFIQTDAAINPGNSGGPLLNMAGQVVGMNTAIASRTGSYAGIGFAIPVNMAVDIAEQLINGGKIERGYLGVGLQGIDAELKKDLNIPDNTEGALIAEVVPDGPADKAGIKPGDFIVGVDGKAVKSTSGLQNTIRTAKPHKSISLDVYRDGNKRTIAVKLSEWPKTGEQEEQGEQGIAQGDRGVFGLSVADLNPALRKQYRVASKKGVVVTGVQSNSTAERAGLEPGDVIISANGQQVGSKKDFEKVQKNAKKLVLRIERDGSYFFVPLRK